MFLPEKQQKISKFASPERLLLLKFSVEDEQVRNCFFFFTCLGYVRVWKEEERTKKLGILVLLPDLHVQVLLLLLFFFLLKREGSNFPLFVSRIGKHSIELEENGKSDLLEKEFYV